jgi:hypothetical protein
VRRRGEGERGEGLVISVRRRGTNRRPAAAASATSPAPSSSSGPAGTLFRHALNLAMSAAFCECPRRLLGSDFWAEATAMGYSSAAPRRPSPSPLPQPAQPSSLSD